MSANECVTWTPTEPSSAPTAPTDEVSLFWVHAALTAWVFSCRTAFQCCRHAAIRANKRNEPAIPCIIVTLHYSGISCRTSEGVRKQSLPTLLKRGPNLTETFLFRGRGSWKYSLPNIETAWSGVQNILIKEKMLIHFPYLSGLLFPGSGLWHSWHQYSQPYTTHQHNGCIILTGPCLSYSNACWRCLVTGGLCQQFCFCINPFV